MEEKKILVTYAVPEELIDIQWNEKVEFLYVRTGIGKVKSAHYVTNLIQNFEPDAVLNIGTAGSVNLNVGDIVCCTQFIDRDIKAVSETLKLGYSIDTTLTLMEHNVAQHWPNRGGVCNTGDSFVTNPSEIVGDVVDMEAYAQAFVCEQFEVPFIAVKCVTDIIGQNSVSHWEEKLSEANSRLDHFINNEIKNIFTH